MLLTALLLVPLLAGLLCLIARPRWLLETLNLLAFATTLALAVALVGGVLASANGAVTAWGDFLRADALSAWMMLMISFVSLII